MRLQVAFTDEANSTASDHLLQHYRRDVLQEDLCFALWRPSTGDSRSTALIDQILLPEANERSLHGNASFHPAYVGRVVRIAMERRAGLAFMHSHPSPGWQGMSSADVEAERDVLAYPAGATDLPLLGLTIGIDGYWSARLWKRQKREMRRKWCDSVRIVGPQSYRVDFNDKLCPAAARRNILKRTFDTWGQESQDTISRLRVGIVGLGSVGCLVAEAIARIGVSEAVLIDPDKVEQHNLDRLLYGTIRDIGQLKVGIAARAMRRHATAKKIRIATFPISVHKNEAYKAALDCDIIFSCVDRPVARDVLNYIAQAHLIPVIDGGIAVETDQETGKLFSAHWRAHLVTPYHQCMRCNGQYNTSAVVLELDGSLDDPAYVINLPSEQRQANQNVFPFSLSVAAMEVNLMLRYILASDWWPQVQQQDYQFVTGKTRVINSHCHPNCSFPQRRAQGDSERPFYLTDDSEGGLGVFLSLVWRYLIRFFYRVFWRY